MRMGKVPTGASGNFLFASVVTRLGALSYWMDMSFVVTEQVCSFDKGTDSYSEGPRFLSQSRLCAS
jgi:hypothetical protein